MRNWSPVKRVVVPGMPELPNATWSNCLVLGNEVVMTGVTANPAVDEFGNTLSTEEQGRRIFERIDASLRAAGGTRANVYKLVIYLTDIADKGVVSQLRSEFFGPIYPCSTLVQVGALVFPGLTIEVEAYARLDCDISQATPFHPV